MKKGMKKSACILFLMLIMLVFSSCSREKVDTSKFNIVTSFYPMYIATANIVEGINDVELKNLTASTTGCLHDYQLTTSNMITLSKADVLVINGGGMESFIEKAVTTYDELAIIDASEGILENHHHEEHINDGENSGNVMEQDKLYDNKKSVVAEHNHDHGKNAHIWVSISMHIKQVENITNKLMEIDSKNAEKYMTNANTYIQKLESLKKKMSDELLGVENNKIVTFHEAFDFFAEEFNLDIVAVIEREPGTYPSAGEVADIIDLIRSKEVKAIFVEPQYSRSAADTIARETGIGVYTLDPIVTGELNKDTYIDVMNNNLNILKTALK